MTTKRKARKKANPWTDYVDAVDSHCLNIATLARLLECSDEGLPYSFVERAGTMIFDEVQKLNHLLRAFGKEARR